MSLIRVADEVWIAAALLHRRYPGREDFTVGEIVRRAADERVTGGGGGAAGGAVPRLSPLRRQPAAQPGALPDAGRDLEGAAAAVSPGRSLPPAARRRQGGARAARGAGALSRADRLVPAGLCGRGAPAAEDDPILALGGAGPAPAGGDPDAWLARLRGAP